MSLTRVESRLSTRKRMSAPAGTAMSGATNPLGAAHAMPMNGGVFPKAVGQRGIQTLAESHAVDREGRLAIKPGRRRSGIAPELDGAFRGAERGRAAANARFGQPAGGHMSD